jgi:hypothetical protein
MTNVKSFEKVGQTSRSEGWNYGTIRKVLSQGKTYEILKPLKF